MIKKTSIDMGLIHAGLLFPLHKIRPSKGENITRMEGIPMIKCNLRGKGNIAAPAIDTEKDRSIHAGITLSLVSLHARDNPMMNNTLKTEHKINPAENAN